MYSQQLNETLAVLVHGCHVEATDWNNIIIGTDLPNGKIGRATLGVATALKLRAAHIIWGTGASERDGIKEARVIFEEVLRHASEITTYCNEVLNGEYWTETDLVDYLKRFSIFDTVSQNTRQETAEAASFCESIGISTIVQVSSPTHIARCFQEALVWKERNPNSSLTFHPLASTTCYANSSASEVVVTEPPHRGDRATLRQDKLVKMLMKLRRLPNEKAFAVAYDICEVLQKHGVANDPSVL
jgi:hypothetical protein